MTQEGRPNTEPQATRPLFPSFVLASFLFLLALLANNVFSEFIKIQLQFNKF